MKLIHLKFKAFGAILCGARAPFGQYQFTNNYIKHPNLNDYIGFYRKNYKWCPDCLKHPEVVMARLNETNV